MFAGVPDTPENQKKFLFNVPLGRLCTPQDVANYCLFLASDEAKFITGTCLEVDGGRGIWMEQRWKKKVSLYRETQCNSFVLVRDGFKCINSINWLNKTIERRSLNSLLVVIVSVSLRHSKSSFSIKRVSMFCSLLAFNVLNFLLKANYRGSSYWIWEIMQTL